MLPAITLQLAVLGFNGCKSLLRAEPWHPESALQLKPCQCHAMTALGLKLVLMFPRTVLVPDV